MITSDGSHAENLVLSVVVEGNVLQFIILSEEDEKKGGTFYQMEYGKKFESIEALLSYYSERRGGYYDDYLYVCYDLDANARNFVGNLKLHSPILR